MVIQVIVLSGALPWRRTRFQLLCSRSSASHAVSLAPKVNWNRTNPCIEFLKKTTRSKEKATVRIKSNSSTRRLRRVCKTIALSENQAEWSVPRAPCPRKAERIAYNLAVIMDRFHDVSSGSLAHTRPRAAHPWRGVSQHGCCAPAAPGERARASSRP